MSSSVSLEYLNQQLSGLTVTSPGSISMSAQNVSGSTIVVILGGTAVPLPSRPYIIGFTPNGANTIFTVGTTGTYQISYQIATTVSLLMSSSVYVNGSALASLTRNPGITATTFAASTITPLTAGDTLQLTLFGLAGTAVLQGGVGAYMEAIRLA